MIENVLQNAINVRIDGVVDPFLTPLGNIAGQFFVGHQFYDFELDENQVRYTLSYHKDAKGKKCPRGYWIPKDHKCRQGTLTPSAQGKTNDIKKALAATIATGLVAGGAIALTSSAIAVKEKVAPSKAVSEEEYKASVDKIEKGIIYKDKEEVSVINPKSGKELYRFKGDETSVNFPSVLPFLEGSTITHNHPPVAGAANGDPRSTGMPFSINDISTACKLNLGEMRAASPGFRYSMKPPEKGWSKDFFEKDVVPSFKRNFTKNYIKNQAMVAIGLKDYRDAQFGVHHDTWKDVAKETGMKYSLDRVPGEKRKPRDRNELARKLLSDADALGVRAVGLAAGAVVINKTKTVAQDNNLLPTDEEVKTKIVEMKEEIWRKLARRNRVRR